MRHCDGNLRYLKLKIFYIFRDTGYVFQHIHIANYL